MSHTNEAPQKTRIAMVCPCCGGEVTHQRYGFDVIVVAPLRMITWYVCDDCEAALTGSDDAARDKTTQAFVDYFEGSDHAPTP
ncbi:MAG: hypothetical protein ACYCZH_10850 [Sulfuriferula sp.]